jgi:hypothetical protein
MFEGFHRRTQNMRVISIANSGIEPPSANLDFSKGPCILLTSRAGEMLHCHRPRIENAIGAARVVHMH